MNSPSCETAFLRHLLKTIQYRLAGVIDDPPPGFGTFAMDAGARTPVQILAHVSDVLGWSLGKLDPSWTAVQATEDWASQVDRYQRVLADLDGTLATADVVHDKALRIAQGPLADVLTHVGQLALIRRLAGSAIPGQNFFVATIPDIDPIA